MDCTDYQKVSFASFIFQGEVEHWWETARDGAEIFGEENTWRFLVERFNEKYILETARDKLTLKFQELKQGSMRCSV